MEYRTDDFAVSCWVRPLRIAHLIDAEDGYERADLVTDLCTARWGGVYNIAVPMHHGQIEEAWWEVLRWYDPDVVQCHSEEHPDLSEPTDVGLLPFRVLSPRLPVQNPLVELYARPNAVGGGLPLHVQAVVDDQLRRGENLDAHLLVATDDAPYREMLEVLVGSPRPVVEMGDMPQRAPRQKTAVADGEFWNLTPEDFRASRIWMTAMHVAWHAGTSIPILPAPVFVVLSEVTNVSDFCLFWSLRAILHGWCRVLWVPSEWLRPDSEAILAWMLDGLPRHYAEHPVACLTSATMATGTMTGLARRFASAQCEARVIESTEALTLRPNSPSRATPSDIQRHRLAVGCARGLCPPPGRRFDHPHPGLGQWVLDFTIGGLRRDSIGVAYPRVPALASNVVSVEAWEARGRTPPSPARILADGRASVAVTGSTNVVDVTPLGSAEVARYAVAAPSFAATVVNPHAVGTPAVLPHIARGYRQAERSAHGVAAAQLASLLRTWRECGFVLSLEPQLQYMAECTRSARQIADKFMPAGVKVGTAEFRRRHAGIEEMVIPFLVEREMAIQGHYLKCATCGTSQWYPLEDVGQKFTCGACLQTNLTPAHPEYSYKLAPLVARAVTSDQLVPLAVVALLAREAKSDFLWEPETSLKTPADGSWGESDIDVFCIRDGALVIGEAAQDGGFSEADVTKLARLATLLRPVEVVFAVMRSTPKTRDDQFARRLAAQLRPIGTRVTILCRHHLIAADRTAQPPIQFAANPTSRMVHRLTCRHMLGSSKRWQWEYFPTFAEAAKAGFTRPCTTCQPQARN